MKKIIFVITMLMLLVSCQSNEPTDTNAVIETPDNNAVAVTLEETPDNNAVVVEPEEILDYTMRGLSGIWLYTTDRVYVLSLYEDGTLITNDSDVIGTKLDDNEFVQGTWSLEGNHIVLQGGKSLIDESKELTFSIQNLEFEKSDQSLTFNHGTYTLDSTNIIPQHESSFGVYNRTEVYEEQWSSLEINSSSPYFLKLWGMYGSENEPYTLAGLAFYTTNDHSIYYGTHVNAQGLVPKLTVDMSQKDLVMTSNGQGDDFGFDEQVKMDGVYTTGDVVFLSTPIKVIDNKISYLSGLLTDFFGYSEKAWIDDLLTSVDVEPNQLIEYTLPNNHQLVMLYDEYYFIHALITNGFGEQTYMTSNKRYPSIYISDFEPFIENDNQLTYEQVSEDSRSTFDEYVWIVGHYGEPDIWSDPNITQWYDWDNGSEYLEIKVKGAVKSVKLVTLDWRENGFVELGEKASKYDVKDETIVVKTYQSEGIPGARIVVEDLMGNVYRYNISDRSLSGLPGHDNVTLLGMNQVIKTKEKIVALNSDVYIIPPLKKYVTNAKDILPEGWQIKDQVSMDYNEDDLMDEVLILESSQASAPRLFIILENIGEKGYALELLDEKLIEPKDVSGLDNDIYQPLEVENNDLIMTKQFGTNGYEVIRYTLTYDFGWQLKYKKRVVYVLGTIMDYEIDAYDDSMSLRGYNNVREEDLLKATSLDEPFNINYELSHYNTLYLDSLTDEMYVSNHRDIRTEFRRILIHDNVNAKVIDLEEVLKSIEKNYQIFNRDFIVIDHHDYELLAALSFNYDTYDTELEIIDAVKKVDGKGYYDFVYDPISGYRYMITSVEDSQALQVVALNRAYEKEVYFQYEMKQNDPLNFLHGHIELLNKVLFVHGLEQNENHYYTYDLNTNKLMYLGVRYRGDN